MGNRLSKITTKTGDQGETGLADGSRLSKSHIRFAALGDLDELNSCLGVVRSQLKPDDSLQALFSQLQHDVFDLGGELAMPGYQLLPDDILNDLEQQLVEYNDSLPPLKEFILPAGSAAVASCHLARAICRRAERHYVQLSQEQEVNGLGLKYLNRLSDLLFVLARVIARRDGGQEVFWQSRYNRKH